MKRTSRLVQRDLAQFGDAITRWRKLQGISATDLAQRASITRDTLRALERGAGTVQLENVFAVLRALGITSAVQDGIEPLNSELGRLNADRLARDATTRSLR